MFRKLHWIALLSGTFWVMMQLIKQVAYEIEGKYKSFLLAASIPVEKPTVEFQ
jgi:hypothetical protein